MRIFNAATIPLNDNTGTLPQMTGALFDYFQQMSFTIVSKVVKGFLVQETGTTYNFHGVIQPFTPRQLYLKPEGERAWSWYTLHSDLALELQVDDVVTYQGKPTRVMSRLNYSAYGFYIFELVQDFTGSGPA